MRKPMTDEIKEMRLDQKTARRRLDSAWERFIRSTDKQALE